MVACRGKTIYEKNYTYNYNFPILLYHLTYRVAKY